MDPVPPPPPPYEGPLKYSGLENNFKNYSLDTKLEPYMGHSPSNHHEEHQEPEIGKISNLDESFSKASTTVYMPPELPSSVVNGYKLPPLAAQSYVTPQPLMAAYPHQPPMTILEEGVIDYANDLVPVQKSRCQSVGHCVLFILVLGIGFILVILLKGLQAGITSGETGRRMNGHMSG